MSVDPWTLLVSKVIFPLQCLAKGHASPRIRAAMERSQWLPRAALEERAAATLATFIDSAVREVPYWGRLFAAHGIAAREIREPRDLARLPLLDKPTIRAQVESMKRPGAEGLQRSNTGGSSGAPLVFWLGRERVAHDVAAKWRATRWWDVDIGDREMVVWGSPIEVGAQDRLRGWRDALMRTRLLPAFEMSTQKLDRFIAEIRDFRPRMLFGYPSALALIARHAERSGVRLNGLGIAVVFVTSERLYPHQRELISRVFAAPVANGYGGRDAGFIAHECPQGGLHLTAEDIILELLDSAGQAVPDGCPGEVVVTHLRSGDFPFIRYRTGDIATRATDPCACGRGLPLLASVEGRTTDFVVAADGTIMHGLALIYVLRDEQGVEQFRIVQESLVLTRVELVVNAQWDDVAAARVVEALKARLGQTVAISLEYHGELASEASGKHRYVMSRVSPG
ncbi:MAG TPA: capsule biosynthesis protein CapK [Gammaproteobacteria bacterium]|nr:capsule biosynthesis protein CapK [Gammaproteobacteria bacterium]